MGKTLYQIAVEGGFVGTEREYWLMFKPSTPSTPGVETDPIFNAWLGTNPLAAKQDTLISGNNIKTINGNSLLGAGNIVITGATNSYFPSGW